MNWKKEVPLLVIILLCVIGIASICATSDSMNLPQEDIEVNEYKDV